MWPQALQMSRDECRGILRRLELESYSHVISVFRAQGGLSENKAKLLEELRGIFHISQERHRAEARRVASDEQLCTIAEAISGPNTWQEWSREGRRSFPMLPRVAPQTALALIANNVASETASENAKLPFPSDTAAAYAAEHANLFSGREDSTPWEMKREVFVVTDDPFKMPDIPVGSKKNLKRNISDNQSTASNKKRIVGDSSPIKHQQHQKQFHHITANSAQATSPSSGSSNIRKLYHNHNNKTTNQRVNQPQIQKQKLATKKSVAALNTAVNTVMPLTPSKRQATPAKSGRKPNSKIQEQRQQQQALAQQQQLLPQTAVRNIQHVVGEGSEDFNMEQKFAQPQIAASKKDITKNLTKLQLPNVITTPSANVSALSPTPIISGNALPAPLTVNTPATRIDGHQITTALSPPIVGGSGGSTGVPIILHGKVEKQLISTPVQKIILEDRLPPHQPQGLMATSSTTSTATAVVVSSAPTIQLQSTTTPQIMTLPQISAAATKLRAINTTILPPGTKLTAKKSTLITTSGVNITGNESSTLPTGSTSGGGANHTQVFSIIDSNNTVGNAQGSPALPTHTPPAIIQIQNTNTNSMSNESVMSAPQTLQSAQLPTQGKVLTTKLLPKVLGGTSISVGSVTTTLSGNSSSGGNTVNITKIETLNNGATLLSSGGNIGNNPNTSLAGTTTVLKSVGSTILLSPNQSGTGSGGGALFSTLTSGAPVFRKSQIFKTGTIGVSASSAGKLSGTFSTSNSGPQIISNIKLTPAHTTTSITSVTHSNQQQSSTASPFLQQQLKTGIRASVKICQSSNGKMFIQPANMDSASKTKLQSTLSHKILPNAVVSSSSTGAGTSVTHQPQRIAIQKVQIIPAPLHSPGTITGPFHTVTTQSQAQTKPTNTITLSGNKGNMNMVFMPTVGARTTSGTITLSKSANVASGIVAANKVQHTGQNSETVKPNVVIIGSSASQSGTSTTIKPATFLDGNNKYSVTSTGRSTGNAVHLEANQMITEDTPVDILNMPIIVDSGDGTNITMGNNIGDTVTVLPSALIEKVEQQEGQQQQDHQQQQPQPSTIILGATDWEMELDQATAVAAATKAAARTEYHRQPSSLSSGKQHNNSLGDKQQQQQMHAKATIDGETIIIDDSFEDVIVEEQEEGETTDAGTETEGTVDDVETGDETGGEEGQEMTERAYTIFSGSESGEMQPTKQQGTAKIRVGRVQKTYNNNKTAINDDEPIEVIDDDDNHQAFGGAVSEKKPIKKADSERQKMDREVNVENVLNERANNMAAVMECDTDAGFDETIVADIDENTAIEYIEEENNVRSGNDKNELHNVLVTPSSTNAKKQIIESDVIVLDDNDSTALAATATLATASTSVTSEASAVAKDSETIKLVSVATTKSIMVAAGNSNDPTGLH
ncbi:BRCA2-interacting transcriptional repressor EMSY [Ceratitis capitata]|uniref:BRCA2-interacting transcriptional repressor EMSY n=1 Tax=Ceratitis capitata TaxID=7213 RepID=UPI000329ED34|nr:BRCA2-interacting transcriptional repressor EMSY [Ceratitis capitata]